MWNGVMTGVDVDIMFGVEPHQWMRKLWNSMMTGAGFSIKFEGKPHLGAGWF